MQHSASRTSYQIREAAAGSPIADGLLRRYYADLVDLLPGGFSAPDAIAADPGELTPPRGIFLVVELDDLPAGCAAIRDLGAGAFEIKHMWLDAACRGLGIGTALVEHLEAFAIAHGATEVRLDCSSHLDAAIRMYERAGYRRVPAYNANPYADVWFAKSLGVVAPS
ncbi:MAG TPA: GNAT family N-acetyltransferase [Thermomicrobiales bacterium]|nr:GNAT family N-acetyltransferase [Thermomicrobiales bacterium]